MTDENIIYRDDTTKYYFSKCTNEVFSMQGVVALSKHVTHFGSRLGFLYYNLTTPSIVIPLSVTREGGDVVVHR